MTSATQISAVIPIEVLPAVMDWFGQWGYLYSSSEPEVSLSVLFLRFSSTAERKRWSKLTDIGWVFRGSDLLTYSTFDPVVRDRWLAGIRGAIGRHEIAAEVSHKVALRASAGSERDMERLVRGLGGTALIEWDRLQVEAGTAGCRHPLVPPIMVLVSAEAAEPPIHPLTGLPDEKSIETAPATPRRIR
jgi:hypothetical protein